MKESEMKNNIKMGNDANHNEITDSRKIDGKKLKLWVAIVKIIVLCLFTAALIYSTIRFAPSLTHLVSEPDELKDFLASYGLKGVLVFILIQMIQVIVAAIPGEPVQIAGGYIYGVFLGTVYSLVGIIAGYCIVFAVTRVLGYELVKLVVPVKQYDRFQLLMDKHKSDTVIFLLFLIPGIPKDVLVYIAGLTPIKPLRFFILITIARFPALLGSSYIGAYLQKENYLAAIILGVGAAVLFTACLIFRERITAFLHRFITHQ
jgi:uncharacterized membrane protein YdjX (TVP38/TMEM64 family)